MYQAARATSAAPTYFPAQKIADRSFVDGGLQFNNPSHAIFQHYSRSILVKESQTESASESIPHNHSHGELNFTKVRIINLGTGTKADASSTRPNFITRIIPGVRNATSLATTIREIAIGTENVADFMRSIAEIRGGRPDVKYERFSANNGVGGIKMDGYKDLEEIGRLTRMYLDTPKVKADLKRVGEGIAREYLDARDTESRSASLAKPEQELSRLQSSEGPQTPQRQSNDRLSLYTKSSECTFGTRSSPSKSETLNQSSTGTSLEPSPVPSERLSNSLPKAPSVAKSIEIGDKESEVIPFSLNER